jgi:SpoIID/LytB domain protein
MSRRRSTLLLALSCATAVVVSSPPVASGGSSPVTALKGAQTVASKCPSSGGAKIAEAGAPSGAVQVFGHGWGHGMGMSQYGAQGAARLGCDYRTILATYYRDSAVVTRPLNASVVLKLAGATSGSTLAAENGPVTWLAGSRTVVQPKGSTWSVARRTVNGQPGVVLLDPTGARKLFVANAGLLSARHAGVVVTVHAGSTRLRTKWDTARFIGSTSGIAVTEVIAGDTRTTAVQKYLMGLGEVPVSWPIEALKAQIVAARTYLTSKYSAASGVYSVTTTTSDQVYRGYDQEQKDAGLGGSWHKAVVATDGQVIVDGSGRIIEAMYSSSAGGYTENRQYVYGHYGISYLKAVDDSRWDNASDNPYRKWSKGFTRADLAKRFGFTSVSSWTVARRGTAARLAGVLITGKRAGKTVTVAFTGTEARSKLGVKSPGFTFGPVPVVKPVPTPVPVPKPTPTPTPTVSPTPTPTPSVSPTPASSSEVGRLRVLRKTTPKTPMSR